MKARSSEPGLLDLLSERVTFMGLKILSIPDIRPDQAFLLSEVRRPDGNRAYDIVAIIDLQMTPNHEQTSQESPKPSE